MAITVLEKWSARRRSLVSPWTAYREFTVDGTTDEAAALTATGIPLVNEAHPQSTALLCRGPAVVGREGPYSFVIGCDYAIPQSGEFATSTPDPLDEEPEYEVQTIDMMIPVDCDVAGRPILNSCGDRPSTLPTRRVTYKRIIIERNEPFFDVAVCAAYENHVNADDMTIGGVAVTKEFCCMRSYHPLGKFKASSAYVKCQYIFDVVFDDQLGKYPFQYRMMNVGSRGWWDNGGDPKKAQLTDEFNNPINEVKLGLNGLPIEAGVYVGDGHTPRNTPGTSLPKVYAEDYDTEHLDLARFLIYQESKTADFTALGL